MKKVILTIAAIIAFGITNAQDLKYGARAGLDMVSISYGGASQSLTGFFIGGFADYQYSDKIVIQPGLSYNSASTTVAGHDIKSTFVSIPVLAKYKVGEKISAIGGLALFYDMDSEVKTDKLRFNLEIGGAYDITENIFIDPRYSLGLNGEAKINHFLIGLGYKF